MLIYSTDDKGNDFRREPANTDPADLRKTGRRAFVIEEGRYQQNGADHDH